MKATIGDLTQIMERLRARAELFKGGRSPGRAGLDSHEERMVARVLDEVADAIEETIHVPMPDPEDE